ncbi:MAG: hypothetical protein M3R02_06835 [Chloroflexota bacterium]|nr:hypothetical protein [Chloroflexota bacterium]
MTPTRWDALTREGNKRDRLGQYARCTGCGEADPRCLQGPRGTGSGDEERPVLCAECRLAVEGKSRTERHHPAGRANDPIAVPIPANDHAVLSDAQHDWPMATLRNPDGSPLLAAAAALRGWLDVLRLVVERTVGWIPAFLEWLDAVLRSQVAERWWETFSWEGGPA